MGEYVRFGIRLICYLMAVVGALSAVYFLLLETGSNYVGRLRFEVRDKTRTLRRMFGVFRKGSPFREHIDKLHYMVGRESNLDVDFIRFVFASVLAFVGTLTATILALGAGGPISGGVLHLGQTHVFNLSLPDERIGIMLPLAASLIAACLPYVRLRYRYALARVKSSYELLEVVRLLSGESHLAVGVAVSRVASMIGPESSIKRPLKMFSETLLNYVDDDELIRAGKAFSAAVGTAFAVMFVSVVLHCVREGRENWEASLLTLSSEMEAQRMAILDTRSASRDAINLGTYGNILVYLVIAGTMAYFMRPSVFFTMQFQTKVGLTGFVITFALILASYIWGKLLARLRLDYY